MKILEIIKFNDGIGIVVDEMPKLTYEEIGGLLIGSDDANLTFDCLYYDRPTAHFKAFAGREFDLPLKNGGTVHCNGQWWSGKVRECSEKVGITLGDITINCIDKMKDCYVMFRREANWKVYCQLVHDFLASRPDYQIWGYHEYELHLTGRGCGRQDHPNEEFQKKIRKMFDAE